MQIGTGMYGRPSQGSVYSPFNLKVNPMQKLFLIGFEKDPDRIYKGFEPQWFDDEAYGKGLRVIAWRNDGYVDVFQQPGLPLERNFDVAAKGLLDLIEHPMPNARFNISASGVDASFAFEDKEGRQVKVEISEKSSKPTNPFTLLAPVGKGSETPSALPVYFLHQFCFVRRTKTLVRISIDGRLHTPDPFPLPLDGSRVYYMRYAGDTCMADWCVARTGELAPLKEHGGRFLDADNTSYDVVHKDGQHQIKRMSGKIRNHIVSVEFDPPFPDITCLNNQSPLEGSFSISGDDSAGRIGGMYKACYDNDEVTLTLKPSAGWEPRPNTLFLKMLFTVAKDFRNWPKTYEWEAKIRFSTGGTPVIESKWVRT